MARLKVRLRGKTVSELPLAEDRQYLAGRKDDCDIHLQSEKGISREHFRLSSVGGAWTVESLSRFGEVLAGGEKVANLTLEHGMMFSVPPYEFEFLMTTADSAPAEMPAPALMDPSVEGGEIAGDEAASALPPLPHVAPETMEEKTVVGVAPSVPYIKIMDSQGEARELIRLDGGDSYIAGRESSCNIHIRDQRVSRRQFEIRKNGAQYAIIDLGSVNGTLLNGNPISTTDPTPLKSGDAISVLENYLYFELHDPNFKSRLEMVNLQPPSEPAVNPLVPLAENIVPMGALPPVPHGYYPPAAHGAYPPVPQGYYPPVPWGQPPPGYEAPPAEKPKDNKKMRIRLILGGVALIAVAFALTNNKEPAKPQTINPLYNDPLSKLTPEQKKLVKDTYQLAKSYYMQGKYAFARSELIKMQEILPAYEDSDGLMKLVNEAIDVQQQQKKQEELERARAEQEEKIQFKAAQCRKLLNPNITREEMENCIVEVLPFNPAHPLLTELLALADKMVSDKAAREAQNAAHASAVAKLKGIYGKAKGVDEKSARPLEAIAAYERVIATALPDPSDVKGASRDRIAQLKKMIDQKTAKYQADAKRFAEEGKLKDAIISLRHARQVDPTNPYLQPAIDEYKARLQEQMMVIYQEGILEESFGNVDGDESKPGAKQKWKRILSTDVTDGEYYKKAYIKMKKYGAPR